MNAFEPHQPVRENRNVPRPRLGHVIGEPTNDGCDYEVEWRDGTRETVDRTEIVTTDEHETLTHADRLETLDGTEFHSAIHEGIVGIKAGQVIRFGATLESQITPAMGAYLLASLIEEEIGGKGPSGAVYTAAEADSEYANPGGQR